MSGSAEHEQKRSWPVRLLGWTVSVSCSRPRLMLWLMLLLGCGAVGYSVSFLEFRGSRSDSGSRLGFLQRSAATEHSFGDERDLLIVVRTESPNGRLIRSVIDTVGDELARDTRHFQHVLSRVNLTAMKRKALQFLSREEMVRTEARLNAYDRVVRNQEWNLVQADTLTQTLVRQIERQQQAGHVQESSWNSANRLATSLSSWLQHSVKGDSAAGSGFRAPLPDLLSVASDQKLTDSMTAYLINDLETVGVVQVGLRSQGIDAGTEADAINALRTLLAEAREAGKWPEAVSVSVTGMPALEHEELQATAFDMARAGLLSILLLGLVLWPVFRGGRHPMLVLMTLVLALCLTSGAATALVSKVTLISSCCAIFVIGMCVDFSVSFINRYLALRQELYEIPDALREVAETTGSEIQVSSVTTALAFSTALLSGYPELAELGALSAIGILISAASVLLFLPSLIAVCDEETEMELLPAPAFPPRLKLLLTSRPVIIIPMAMLLLGAAAAFAVRTGETGLQSAVEYNSSQIDLLDPASESVVAERVLETAGTETVLHAVSVAETWEDAVRLREALLRLPSVARVSDAASKLPDPPDASTRQFLQQLQRRAAETPGSLPQLSAANFEATGRFAEQLYLQARESDHPQAVQAAAALDQFLNDLSSLSGQQAESAISAWNTMVARWLLLEYQEIASANRFDAVGLEDLPPELHSRFLKVDADGRQHWALRIYPRDNIWSRTALEEFVEELREVDPAVAGKPVEMLESVGRLHTRSAETGLYAVAVIMLVLLFSYLRRGQKLMTVLPPLAAAGFIGYTFFQRTGFVQPWLVVSICLGLTAFIAAALDYRNLRDTVMTLIPAIGGGVVLLGVMGACGFELNPMNLIALPMVFAIGIDNGIYLVRDCRSQIADEVEEYEPSDESLSGAVTTSLTSIAVFGSLLISRHEGLFSMGLLLTIGVSASLLVSLLLMPSLLVLVARHQPASMTPVQVIRVDSVAGSGDEEYEDEDKQAKAA